MIHYKYLISVTDALGNTTSYAFNAVGNLTSITDARGNVTSYTYDNLNRRITETYPDAAPNTKTVTYDAVGNLLTRTDQKGQVQTHLYDDLYRLLTRSTPGWPADTFSYDVGGRMLTATRAGWVVTYTYDAANRVSQSTQGTQSIGYSYNIPAGTRTITYPSGRVITEESDLRGRLAAVKEGTVNIASYSYDNGNRVDTRTYQNGVVADYTYDANNRITSLTHNHGATLIAGFTHQYDDEGNKKNEEKLHQTGASEAYAYDSIYRLVDYKVGPLVAGTVPVPTTQTAYNLDAVGNWDSKTTDSVTENRTHNAANEITAIGSQAISHDNNGNLTHDANYDYTFDENNRLIGVAQASVPVASYAYDAMGRRISKVVGSATTVFYYDNARIIEERDGSNNIPATYTFGNYIDEVLTATRPAPLGTLYYHQNTLWSVHALTDAAGAVVEHYTYDAYGTITVLDPLFVPLSSTPLAYFTFTGREYEAETGLYHYRARTYGPGLGRFYSRDPLGYVDGMNLYEYVRGNPSVRLDALGLDSDSETKLRAWTVLDIIAMWKAAADATGLNTKTIRDFTQYSSVADGVATLAEIFGISSMDNLLNTTAKDFGVKLLDAATMTNQEKPQFYLVDKVCKGKFVSDDDPDILKKGIVAAGVSPGASYDLDMSVVSSTKDSDTQKTVLLQGTVELGVDAKIFGNEVKISLKAELPLQKVISPPGNDLPVLVLP